jgi:hypothetical protein
MTNQSEMEEFLTGVRHTLEPDTVLATVLFTRIVGDKEHAERLGHDRWTDLIRRLHSDVAGMRRVAIVCGPTWDDKRRLK